ncbi:MAG: hypothetical protein FWF63_06615 [Fibromonadales bacterium]|nr:hypothetical protein [Fibromonadales bacterium]
MKNNPFLLLAASLSLAMIFTFSCSGDGNVIDSISNSGASEVWDGRINTTWYDDSKKEFTITTAQQLAGLAKLVNNGTGFAGKTVKLGKTINLSGIEWTPIGTLELGFAGIFDGNGYEIIGVYVKNPEGEYQGLFGGIEGSGEIKKLGVIDSDIEGSETAGGLAGYNNGKISDSYFIGRVSAKISSGGLVGQNYMGIINKSYSDGLVVAVKGYAGGIVGANVGTISNSYSTSKVTGGDGSNYVGKYGKNLGGFVGYNAGDGEGIIINCYSTGTVTGEMNVGGFVGMNEGEISNSYSIGSVSGDTIVGGFTGLNEGEISNSYSIGAVSGDSFVGGFVGQNQAGTIDNSFYNTETSKQSESKGGTGKTTAEMKEQATYTGWDFSKIWGLSSTENSGYPYLRK